MTKRCKHGRKARDCHPCKVQARIDEILAGDTAPEVILPPIADIITVYQCHHGNIEVICRDCRGKDTPADEIRRLSVANTDLRQRLAAAIETQHVLLMRAIAAEGELRKFALVVHEHGEMKVRFCSPYPETSERPVRAPAHAKKHGRP